MNTNDLINSYSLDEILDELEDEHVGYTAEPASGYFLCSGHCWDGLSPERQVELMEQYPHLEAYFTQ